MLRRAMVRTLLVIPWLLLHVTVALAQPVMLDIDHVDDEGWIERSALRFYVDVLDADFRVQSGLTAESFKIFVTDSKEPVSGRLTLDLFRDTQEAITVVVVMAGHAALVGTGGEDLDADAAASRPNVFALEKAGVRNFLERLDDGVDRVAVFLYDEAGLRQVDPFSAMPSGAARAVAEKAKLRKREDAAGGAPRLYDHLESIIGDKIAPNTDLPRRRILLVLSDGLDVNAGRPDRVERRVQELSELARDEGVKVYAMGFSLGSREGLGYLKQLATRTGGAWREIPHSDVKDIPAVYEELADQIKKQYVLTLVSDDLEGGRRYRFRVTAEAGGRSLEAEFDRTVKLGEKPIDWMRWAIIAGAVLGGLLLLFVFLKVIAGIRRRRAARAEAEANMGPPPGDLKGRFSVTTGPHTGQEFYITSDMVTIGTMPSNDICLEMDDATSKRHAGVKIDDLRFELADFGSTNGTFVNGRRINKQFLKDGDRIRIGGTEMVFSLK